jgi:hypothetical protein
MEIAAASDRRISELPYGEQRLLEIAIALSVRPRVLLLDVREAEHDGHIGTHPVYFLRYDRPPSARRCCTTSRRISASRRSVSRFPGRRIKATASCSVAVAHRFGDPIVMSESPRRGTTHRPAGKMPSSTGGTEGSNPSPSRKESTANLTADDLLAGRAIKDAPLALGEDALNQRQLRSRTGITFSL